MISTRIKDCYRIDREIGQGGMGTIYNGYDSYLKRDVAIKRVVLERTHH
jgi:serine/threonine protein kinase